MTTDLPAADPQWIDNDMKTAGRVFSLAIESLQQMAGQVQETLPAAVELIAQIRGKLGRVVVTGMGKSGHVARKIAATMASTGTPALFVHPGEASHGDMGMITENDVVIALSYGGGSAELRDIITYTRRFAIPLIGITGNAESELGKASDILLHLPNVKEACPNGLAPTTSTTAMIALGDALAMALMERAGVTPEAYKVFHPGGKLGARLLLVEELMHKNEALPVVQPGTKMSEALIVMSEKNLGSVIVVDNENNVLGIITDGDLKRHMDGHLLERSVEKIMTANPKSIEPEALAAEAVQVMLTAFKSPITSLLAMKDGKLCGLIQLQSCYAAGVV